MTHCRSASIILSVSINNELWQNNKQKYRILGDMKLICILLGMPHLFALQNEVLKHILLRLSGLESNSPVLSQDEYTDVLLYETG